MNEDIVLPAAAASLPEGLVRRARGVPSRPQPFALLDPATGKPIPESALLTLPDGQRITAGEYYAMLNGVERESAARGVSLRAREPAPPEGVIVDRGELARQSAAIQQSFTRRYRDFAIPAGDPHHELEARHQAAIAADGPRLEALKRTSTLTARRVTLKIPPTVFAHVLGKPELLAASAIGKFEAGQHLEGLPGTMRILGDLAIGASVLKRSADFLKIGLDLLAPPQGAMTARLAVKVLGQDLLNWNHVSDKPFSKEDAAKKTFRMPVTFKLGNGLLGMAVEAAASGEAGLGLWSGVRQAAADVKMSPSVRSKLELAAKADIKIAGVQVRSDVTLADGDLSVVGGARMALRDGQLHPERTLSGDSKMEMLAGKAHIIGYIYKPAFSFPPFKKKEFTFSLWDWPGLKIAGRLFE